MKINFIPLAATAVFGLATASQAATVVINAAAPTVNNADIASTTSTATAGSSTTTTAIGQTFTTLANVGGYQLNAVTVQVNGTALTARTFNVRVGEVNNVNATLTQYNSSTTESGTLAANTAAANSWITLTLDTPIMLAASTGYGFDLSMVSGSNTTWLGNSVSVYAGGVRFADTTASTNTGLVRDSSGNRELAFHLDIVAVPEPSTALLGGLGLLALLRRRRA